MSRDQDFIRGMNANIAETPAIFLRHKGWFKKRRTWRERDKQGLHTRLRSVANQLLLLRQLDEYRMNQPTGFFFYTFLMLCLQKRVKVFTKQIGIVKCLFVSSKPRELQKISFDFYDKKLSQTPHRPVTPSTDVLCRHTSWLFSLPFKGVHAVITVVRMESHMVRYYIRILHSIKRSECYYSSETAWH